MRKPDSVAHRARVAQLDVSGGLGQQVGVDHRSEHRRFPQEQAVRRAERVDSRGDERFDGIGRRRVTADSRADEFEQEQRVADASCDQVVEVVLVEAVVGGEDGAGHGGHVVGGERPDLDGDDVVGGAEEALVVAPAQSRAGATDGW